ncbi:MAG: hypothetical protein ACF8R9_02885 [Phycisphaerales bacterium JB054]
MAQQTPPSENQPADPLAELLAGRGGAKASGARLPSPTEAMDAYAAVESWIREWKEPENVETPAAAVRVSVFQHGRPVGEASEVVRAAGVDAPSALGLATARAKTSIRRELLPRGGVLGAEMMPELTADLTLSVELAGPFTPLSRNELLDPEIAVRPGLTGVAVRVGELWAVEFPSQLMASGTAPAVRLAAMAATLLGDPALGVELLVDLQSERGVSFYRFDVVHLASVGPDGAPVFLTRGNRIVERSAVTTASLVRFAEGLIDHAEAIRIDGEARLGLMGTIHAARGVADPAVALPTQQSLVAYGLVRLAGAPQLPAETRERARTLALAILSDLAHVDPGEIAPADDGVACAILWVALAGVDLADAPDLRALQRTCESMLAAHAAAPAIKPRGTVAEAVLAWAVAERAARTGLDREFAESQLRALVRETPKGGMVGLMPWVGWAELALAGDGPVATAVYLREVRDAVWTYQLTLRDTGAEERDLQGGIVFTSGGLSLPTWNSARPIAFAATMLGDPRLTTREEMPGEVVRLIDAMRFLQQLAAGPAVAAFSRRPELVRGGIRAAVWDPHQPPEATALAMLAVAELLGSLETLEQAAPEGRSGPHPAPGGAPAERP